MNSRRLADAVVNSGGFMRGPVTSFVGDSDDKSDLLWNQFPAWQGRSVPVFKRATNRVYVAHAALPDIGCSNQQIHTEGRYTDDVSSIQVTSYIKDVVTEKPSVTPDSWSRIT